MKQVIYDRYSFIWKAIQKHGYKYDYREVNYINTKTEVKIICNKHKAFWQKPIYHLEGCGCPKCSGKNKTTESVIKEFNEIHKDKYLYDKVIYHKANEHVIVTCKKHGDFLVTPNKHLQGRGCPKCAYEYRASLKRKTREKFINDAKLIHNDIDYSEVVYKNTDTKVKLKCKRCKRIFFQTPSHHLKGDSCPYCKKSKMEKKLMKLFEDNKIEYISQCKFEWLKYKKNLLLDFYLKKQNIAIECQGEQHFKKENYFNNIGKYSFEESLLRDKIKFEQCYQHNIKVIYLCDEKDFNAQYAIENAIYFFDYDSILLFIQNYKEIDKNEI